MLTMILFWIICGALIGLLFTFISNKEFYSSSLYLSAGMAGAVLGGFAALQLNDYRLGYNVLSIFLTVIGAVLVVSLVSGFNEGKENE